MSVVVSKLKCPQNHTCPAIKVCPVAAITQEGYALPQIAKDKCIDCLKCVSFCPMGAIEKDSGKKNDNQ